MFCTLAVDLEGTCARRGEFMGRLQTPSFIAPTIGGNSPYLTSDNEYYYRCNTTNITATATHLNGQSITFEDVYTSTNKIDSFIASNNNNSKQRPVCILHSDTIVPSGSKSSKGKTMETPTGNVQFNTTNYMKIVSQLCPEVYTTMADTVVSTVGKRRKKKAIQNTKKWLSECLEIAATATDDHHSSFIIAIVLVVSGEGDDDNVLYNDIDLSTVHGIWIHDISSSNSNSSYLQNFSPHLARVISDKSVTSLLPLDILQRVAEGIDLFESSYPILLTEGGYASTFWISSSSSTSSGSKIQLRDKKYSKDSSVILEGCECQTCKSGNGYSKAYINHLLNVHEMTANILLYQHNVYHFQMFFSSIRSALDNGTFVSFRKEFELNYNKNLFF